MRTYCDVPYEGKASNKTKITTTTWLPVTAAYKKTIVRPMNKSVHRTAMNIMLSSLLNNTKAVLSVRRIHRDVGVNFNAKLERIRDGRSRIVEFQLQENSIADDLSDCRSFVVLHNRERVEQPTTGLDQIDKARIWLTLVCRSQKTKRACSAIGRTRREFDERVSPCRKTIVTRCRQRWKWKQERPEKIL